MVQTAWVLRPIYNTIEKEGISLTRRRVNTFDWSTLVGEKSITLQVLNWDSIKKGLHQVQTSDTSCLPVSLNDQN